jgi:predicted transglutaminase-like cysteine proteinase
VITRDRHTIIGGLFMTRYSKSVLFAIIAGVFMLGGSQTHSESSHNSSSLMPIMEASPTLAPFQHVRFCLRYPSDCESNPTGDEQVELTSETSELLKRINHSVNKSIIPTLKGYGQNLDDGWTISPDMGDCNDYAVTKRHELLANGLSPKVLRLAVVRTTSGIGHLVLVVSTTKGNVVLDNLSQTIRPWQTTDYRWLKIQSATDAKYWYEVKPTSSDPSASLVDRKVHLADR